MEETTTESLSMTDSFGAELARQAALAVEGNLTEDEVKVLIVHDFLSLIRLLKQHYGVQETSRIIKEAWITSMAEASPTT